MQVYCKYNNGKILIISGVSLASEGVFYKIKLKCAEMKADKNSVQALLNNKISNYIYHIKYVIQK